MKQHSSYRYYLIIPVLIVGLALVYPFGRASSDVMVYQDPEAPIEDRVEDLLSRMTLEEKIGQMTQINISEINTDREHEVELDPERARNVAATYQIGSFLNGFADTPQRWYDFTRELQEIVIEESRLDIPMIYGIDHMHGASYLLESTIFPHNINLANSFNTEMSRQMGKITVLESAHLGHHWNFAPVLDIGRDPRWARFYETYGEDPHLASVLGAAYTEGLEGEDRVAPHRMAATAKHFIAYSTPLSGHDRSPVDLSWQNLQEVHRPPFQAVVDAGIKTVMVNSGEVNGVPVHASKPLLTDLLRDEMGFEGVILTDWADIIKLTQLDEVGFQQEHYHHIAVDEKEATYLAIKAGIDVSMTPQSFDFVYHMKELVEEGKLTEERIDESVRRVLRLKFKLGLFENPFPTTDFFDLVGAEEHKEKALQSARESLVLLENNDGLLPLDIDQTQKILVVGPRADSKRDLSGGWTLEWQGGPEEMYPDDIHTIYTGISSTFSDSEVILMESIGEEGDSERQRFEDAAAGADVIIMALGEEPYTEFIGDINDLTLYEEQLELADVVLETGTPAVLVYVGGRPRVLSESARNSDAILFAGLPGFKGGEAVADIISGKFNPSGKLSFTYPAEPSHFTTYDHKHTDRVTAAWEFGHGLSYSEFEISDLQINSEEIGPDDYLTAEAIVTNHGPMAGQKNVLWFLRNEVSIITRPVRQLKHFEKIELEPGESQTVSFRITPEDHLYYPDKMGDDVIESGYYTLMIGDESTRFYLDVPEDRASAPAH
ncbi:glycoside hydrolase family 3 N-terminal domain-containing protein [Natronogracilivirga saccharolytica]|uniref:beta-glucosidase n=1 Tax=Natronogracilivirga saccharolytica TaxID=2812953 RepID=A0A8J7RK21_9BACT|nr:glycoside hydrolase family 3 N-terminal domain-containing protein [Natronogracilivirga saccharolytica]MBP3191089.1 glycoside hydrolase family 3 C-terminal domain-containing protein [Natronogracilivirga saccharolytica]